MDKIFFGIVSHSCYPSRTDKNNMTLYPTQMPALKISGNWNSVNTILQINFIISEVIAGGHVLSVSKCCIRVLADNIRTSSFCEAPNSRSGAATPRLSYVNTVMPFLSKSSAKSVIRGSWPESCTRTTLHKTVWAYRSYLLS
jgi:hypothetical protein